MEHVILRIWQFFTALSAHAVTDMRKRPRGGDGRWGCHRRCGFVDGADSFLEVGGRKGKAEGIYLAILIT
jgi:hypothetical protein